MRRKLEGKWELVVKVVGILYALFHIYTAGFGLLPGMQQRAVHILFGLCLTFLLRSGFKRKNPETKIPIWDIVLIGLVIIGNIHALLKYEWYYFNIGESTAWDLLLGSVIILLAVEAGRRVTGWVFPALTTVMIFYVFIGPYIPGSFGHRGFSFEGVVQQLYQSTLGVYGFITGISATIIAGFFILVAFLLNTGGGKTLIELSILIAGRYRGGPALVAVVASSMFATISGGPSTNVAATGSFTIPMMKRLGYEPHFAGAVEAAASCGGSITPPVMGAAAFIIAEFLGIPYISVAIAAVIPALLFYIAVFSGVKFEALKRNLAPIPIEDIPKWQTVITWKKISPLFLPLIALLVMLGYGYTPVTSTFWALITAIVIYTFADFSLINMKQRLKVVVAALEQAGKSLINIVPLFVCANIVVSLITMTGIGVKLGVIISNVAGDSMLLTLILAGSIALIMGMGMPTSASYLIAIAIIGPVMKSVNILPLSAHLFVFYYALLSNITPPVCLACYVAAGIAEAPWLKLAFITLRLAMIAYLVPFMFVYNNELLLIGDFKSIAMILSFSFLGTFFLGSGTAGFFISKLGIISRSFLIAGAIMCLFLGWKIRLIGVGLIIMSLIGSKLSQSSLIQESA